MSTRICRKTFIFEDGNEITTKLSGIRIKLRSF